MNTIAQNEQLTDMLDQLKEGKLQAIEYGDSLNPSGFFTGIRISFINTAGGPQFRICQVGRGGMECGGIYERTAEEIFSHAMRMQERHDRPIGNPMVREYLEEARKKNPPPVISWFGIEKFNKPFIHPVLPPFPKDAIDINL